jgi:4-hydroxybenzoate polyprenyltransferase
LLFIPLFFSLGFFNTRALAISLLGFVIFSVLASLVYVFNDMRDIEKDRLHPVKRLRPLASGEISRAHACIILRVLAIALLILVSLLLVLENRRSTWLGVGLLAIYMVLNIGYSYGLKNIPLVDISILASGYVIRVLFGSLIIGSAISVWLYLVLIVGAYYLGLGKRRNEIIGAGKGGETRAVMRFYSHDFLDKNMYMCQALCVVFYALWSIDPMTVERFNTSAFVYTIPLMLIILLKYNLNIESDSDGDPTSVILRDRILLGLCVVYIFIAFFLIYANRSTA